MSDNSPAASYSNAVTGIPSGTNAKAGRVKLVELSPKSAVASLLPSGSYQVATVEARDGTCNPAELPLSTPAESAIGTKASGARPRLVTTIGSPTLLCWVAT